MQVLSLREALGGRWGGNFAGWAILLLPTSMLVVLQQSASHFPGWPQLVALAMTEHVVGGAIIAAVVLSARRIWPIIPTALMFILWAVVGIVRGLVWAAFAVWFFGEPADLGYRILVWVGISVIWSPLFTYALAQLDHRRYLLGSLTAARIERTAERALADRSARDRRAQLVATVQRTISPVIRELHRSLAEIKKGTSDTSIAAMSERLGSVAYDAARLVAPAPVGEQVTAPPAQRAPLSAAVDFPQERPVFAAFLAGTALLPLVVPDALRVYGYAFALRATVAVASVAIVLSLSLIVLRWFRLRWGKPSEATIVLFFLVPGLMGSLVLYGLPGEPSAEQIVPLLVILPFGALFSGACLSASVGLAYSNEDLAERVEAIRAESAELRAQSVEADLRAREQLAELLHGPVYGRLSACAMALNFSAAELVAGASDYGDQITATVLEYLDAASRDLDALAST